MLRSAISVLIGISIAGLVATAALAEGGAKNQTGSATETVKVLLKQPLKGMDGKEAKVALIDIPAGWQTPSHTHPGNLFVYVLQGKIEVDIEGGGKQTAKAGEVIYEAPDHPMVGRNASSSEAARILVFQVANEGEPLTVPHEK